MEIMSGQNHDEYSFSKLKHVSRHPRGLPHVLTDSVSWGGT